MYVTECRQPEHSFPTNYNHSISDVRACEIEWCSENSFDIIYYKLYNSSFRKLVPGISFLRSRILLRRTVGPALNFGA
jgi:hypothetical protein